MDAQASTSHARRMFAPVFMVMAFVSLQGQRLVEHAQSVGSRFHADIGAESNPVKDIAVGFILISISLIIALTILPTLTSAVETAATDGNISATDATLLRLLPTLLIVGLLAGGVAFLFKGFKNIRS